MTSHLTCLSIVKNWKTVPEFILNIKIDIMFKKLSQICFCKFDWILHILKKLNIAFNSSTIIKRGTIFIKSVFLPKRQIRIVTTRSNCEGFSNEFCFTSWLESMGDQLPTNDYCWRTYCLILITDIYLRKNMHEFVFLEASNSVRM